MVLIYCYDAYCGWCYGFSPVIREIETTYINRIPVEVLSGGMITPDIPQPIGTIAGYMQTAYKSVEDYTGIRFGEDYLWHIFHPEQSDWYPHSEKPSIALCGLKKHYPEKAVSFAADLQYALHSEGRDLTDDEAYRHLLPQYNIDADSFYQDLHNEEIKKQAYGEFNLVKQLQITSFPTLLLQISENKFYLIAKGYADFNTVNSRIIKILEEIGAQ